MGESAVHAGLYRPRNPEKTAYYRILKGYFPEFRARFAQFEQKYGWYRKEIDLEYMKYVKCGIPKYGFARIRCENPDCGRTMLLAFSCKSKHLCPSCAQKHMLLTGMTLLDQVIASVPHRHFVFAIPVLLRRNFFWHRESLNDLSRIAWATLLEFFHGTFDICGVPGAIQSIETSGEYHDINPHIHTVATDGILDDTGSFHPMPEFNARAKWLLKSLWERNVTRYCLTQGYVRPETVNRILSQRHTGFSVYADTRVNYKPEDKEAREKLEHLLRYIVKPVTSMEKIEWDERGRKVLYKGHFHKGKRRNFEVFDPVDFIARITSHIPNKRQKYINYYGWYSNKSRGVRNKVTPSDGVVSCDPFEDPPTDDQRQFGKIWAMLIQKVWEVDPLVCPKCKSPMKVVAILPSNEEGPGIEQLCTTSPGVDNRGPPVVDTASPDDWDNIDDIYPDDNFIE